MVESNSSMKRKLRVLHILNSNKYSGAENVVITMINHMRDHVDFAYESLNGQIQDVLKENNIKFYPVSKTSPNEIRRIVHDFGPDIIHAHDFTAGIAAALTHTEIPIINHLHNNSPWIKNYGMKSFAYGICANRFDKILTVSDSIMDEYVFGSRFRQKTVTVGNPVDIKKIRLLAGVEDLDDSKETGKKYDIAFLGRETPPKNPLRLLKIIAMVKDSLEKRQEDKVSEELNKHRLKAIMIGDGEMKDEVNDEIKRLHLQENITCIGFQSNPYRYLKTAKVMLMPSSWEGFGLAAVEGLALGLPVVASAVGGLKDIVTDKCGKLCDTDQEFVNEILRLLTDKEYYSNKSGGALCRAEDYNNMNKYMDSILEIYDEVSRSVH